MGSLNSSLALSVAGRVLQAKIEAALSEAVWSKGEPDAFFVHARLKSGAQDRTWLEVTGEGSTLLEAYTDASRKMFAAVSSPSDRGPVLRVVP